MDGVNLYIIVGAVSIAVTSVLLNFTGRQKYKDNASFFESANNELREQNTSFREENGTFKTELASANATITSQSKIIEQLKPFSAVVTTMSNNHTTVMKSLSDITKLITGKVDGHN